MDGLQVLGVVGAAVLGAIFGSFINVLAIRWHEGASLGGRSRCVTCQAKIPAYHLIPVISWIALRGRCSACHARISPQYVLVEVCATGLAVITALRHGPFQDPVAFAFELFIVLSLLVPLVMDLRWQEVPVEYVLGLGGIGVTARSAMAFAAAGPAGLGSVVTGTLIAACGVSVLFGGQVLLSRGRWLGTGDLWLGLGLAGLLGARDTGIAIYLAYLLGGGAAMLALGLGALGRKTRVPFVPALVAGTMGALWAGDAIAAWVSHAVS